MAMESGGNRLVTVYRWCRRRSTALSWAVVGVAVVLTIVLGMIGFSGIPGKDLPLTTRFYLALQLLTLESGGLDDLPRVSWTLEVARFAGVTASLGTVLNALLAVFGRRIHRFLVRRMTGHVVVVGAGQIGTRLATDLLAEGQPVTIIEIDESNTSVTAVIERGANEVIGDAVEQETLLAASAQNAEILIVVTDGDTRNLEIVSAAGVACRKRHPDLAPLQCYVHVSDARLTRLHENRSLADGETSRLLEITTFDRFTNSARLLSAEAPLDREGIVASDDRQVHLVIIDLSPMGEALLKQALHIGHYANRIPLAVTIVDESATKKEQELLARIPELHQCGNLTFIDGLPGQGAIRERLGDLLNDPGQMVSLAVCREDTQAALTGAMDLVPQLTKSNNTVFVNVCEDEHAAALLNAAQTDGNQLIPFGNSDAACSSKAVVRRELDLLARRIHDEYRAKRKRDGDSEEDYPAMKPWERIDAEVRDMNRHQADHIPVKLRALGCRMVAGSTDEDAESFHLDETEIESLAKGEHARWCASRRLSGWRYGSLRDDSLKHHPDLIPWEELSETTREYDRDPVRNLPKLLAAIGYRIERLPH